MYFFTVSFPDGDFYTDSYFTVNDAFFQAASKILLRYDSLSIASADGVYVTLHEDTE